jgi:hypothetical protein
MTGEGHNLQRANSRCLPVGLLLFFLLVTASASPAGVVTQVLPPYFGEIDLHPGGDTVTIAAQSGPAVPSAERSAITGGSSGLLTITSNEAEQAEVIYPDSVTLTSGGHTITIRGIPWLSQKSTNLPGGNVRRELSIGGSLSLRGDENRGNYSGSMTIQLNFL